MSLYSTIILFYYTTIIILLLLSSYYFYTSTGTVDFLSFTPRYCLVYNSSLAFFPPKEQVYTSLNLTLQLATDFKFGDNITISLPGFTNSGGYSSTYPSTRTWGHTSTITTGYGLTALSGGGRQGRMGERGLEPVWNPNGKVKWEGVWTEGVCV